MIANFIMNKNTTDSQNESVDEESFANKIIEANRQLREERLRQLKKTLEQNDTAKPSGEEDKSSENAEN